MTKSDALLKYVQKIVKECISESWEVEPLKLSTLLKLYTGDEACETLDGLTTDMRKKLWDFAGKPMAGAWKTFTPEEKKIWIDAYEKDRGEKINVDVTENSKREGLANMYMPNSIGDTEARNIKAI